ncbi:glycoside hydrolase [Inquilinus sp. KBS0705]|nr:glycoside hydrolase [Inquilinus sp. KBS0705]
MKKKIFTTALLSCCFMICLAAAVFADLNGKWTGNLTMADGNSIPVTYDFKVDGEKLTGTAQSPEGDVALENGKIKGDDFSFSVNVNGMDIPHSGKVYADSVGMDLSINDNKAHFVLKRVAK